MIICDTHTKPDSHGYAPEETEKLYSELNELRKDKARIDWLADVNNTIGGVQLPRQCVENNIHCMRAAIDAAMDMDKQ